ncbi:hypothetical protein XF35_21905 [Streptomyces platensis subsp. clarensis]|nr:hypothetical protein [Streptomyces platensis subsp. clarensis]
MCRARVARIARAWSPVHTLAARPNRTPFASRRASASSVKGCTVTTGTATSRGTGCAVRDRPVSRSPQTTFNTPGGRCSAAIRASSEAEDGVVSAGFRTVVLPAASAGATFHAAIISG